MKTVSVSEFRDRATSYLFGGEPICISEHGRMMGVYLPVEPDQARVERALDRLGETVKAILDETGMTEDELVEFLDPKRPPPD